MEYFNTTLETQDKEKNPYVGLHVHVPNDTRTRVPSV